MPLELPLLSLRFGLCARVTSSFDGQGVHLRRDSRYGRPPADSGRFSMQLTVETCMR